MRGRHVDLVGQVFGRLNVIARDEEMRTKDANSWWICHCSCGKIKSVRALLLKNGSTKSCGCYLKEFARQRSIDGTSAVSYTHGMTHSKEYSTWESMRQRCNNPKHPAFKNYGGRGILVCDRWNISFEDFYKDMGPRPDNHSIDRINNDGGYSLDNCRWATEGEQKLNRRDNRLVTIGGVTKQLTLWSLEYKIPFDVLSKRLNAGWEPEKAASEPVKVFDREITYLGDSKPVSEWAKITQMPVAVLLERIAKGWGVDRSINQPYRKTSRSPITTHQ